MTPSADLRERILDAALRLFADRGYDSTSVREVVEAVGCTKPALYYYFANKEDLYLEVVHSQMQLVAKFFNEVAGGPGPVRQRLERFVETLLQRVQARPHVMRLLLTAEHRPADGKQPQVDLMSIHMENLRHLVRLLDEGVQKGEIRADVPTEDLALAFIGMVNLRALGCVHDLPPPPGIAKTLIDLFFNGVRPPETP